VKKTKAERNALAEEQRRQNASVIDEARDAGMTGNRPAGVTAPKKTKAETKE
jgi:hypothetical protein